MDTIYIEHEFQFLIVLVTASSLLRIQGKQDVSSETGVLDTKKLPI